RNVIALSLHDLVDHRLLFFLFDGFTRLVLRRLRRSKRIASTSTGGNQDMPGMNLLFRLSVFSFCFFLFNLDDVKAKLTFDDVANLTWLQGKSSLFKLRHHLTMAKPAQVSAFFLTAGS